MEIVFATNNKHKISEIAAVLPKEISLKSLSEIGFSGDIPETNPTIKENASQKSHYIYDRFKINVLAEDTGLEIEALNGAPGVYSARYAGEHCSFEDNVIKVLKEMGRKTNRKARFITIISLILNDKEFFFEGIVNGHIINEPIGNQGFGYDPIFIPDGYNETYAQMSSEIKNKISHRALATQKFINFIQKQSL